MVELCEVLQSLDPKRSGTNWNSFLGRELLREWQHPILIVMVVVVVGKQRKVSKKHDDTTPETEAYKHTRNIPCNLAKLQVKQYRHH